MLLSKYLSSVFRTRCCAIVHSSLTCWVLNFLDCECFTYTSGCDLRERANGKCIILSTENGESPNSAGLFVVVYIQKCFLAEYIGLQRMHWFNSLGRGIRTLQMAWRGSSLNYKGVSNKVRCSEVNLNACSWNLSKNWTEPGRWLENERIWRIHRIAWTFIWVESQVLTSWTGNGSFGINYQELTVAFYKRMVHLAFEKIIGSVGHFVQYWSRTQY